MSEKIEASAERIAVVTKAICNSRKFESGHGTCAFLCMSGLGDVRKSGCAYHQQIHGDMALQIVDALDKAGAA